MTHRPRPIRSLALGGAAACGALLLLYAAPALGAPTEIGEPKYEYRFTQYLADGGGAYHEMVSGPFYQTGSALAVEVQVGAFQPPPPQPNPPEMEVASNFGALPFWVATESPVAEPHPHSDEPIGTKASLTIFQSFRKDEEDATLSFTITQAKLIGLDSTPDDDHEYVEVFLNVDVAALDTPGHSFYSFFDLAHLLGLGRANPGPGPCDPDCWAFTADQLPLAVVLGGLDQGYVEYSLTAPFTRYVDLSQVAVGQEFTLRYTAVAFSIDTAQVDTGGTASFKDPLNADAGTYFEYTGLTVTDNPVPEPGGPLLLVAGLGVLLSVRVTRR
jgi:hypothetical protein